MGWSNAGWLSTDGGWYKNAVVASSNTIYSATAGADNPGNNGYCFRHEVSVLSSTFTQVRVSIKASTTQGLVAGHVSIGVSSMANGGVESNAGETTAVPTELTFGGVSGINVASGVVAVSDWINFSGIDSTHNAIVTIDITTGGVVSTTSPSPSAVNILWFKSGATAWNVQTPVGFSGSHGDPRSIVLIETR